MLLHPIIGTILSVWGLIIDEHYVADPLHVRRSGFAASKGQSSVVAVH